MESNNVEISRLYPIFTIFPVLAPVGHFGTAWSKPFKDAENGKYKKALTVIGVLYVLFIILMVSIPFIVIMDAVCDSVVTSSEMKQGIGGIILSEMILAAGVFACWVAGIILSWEVYNSTKASYKLSKH